VLTLGGELDGLTRVTRIAKEWQATQQRVAADGPEALYRFPVVVLPGQSHSQFCSGVNVTAFGHKDAMPEVSWPVAHAAIAEATAQFLALVTNPSDTAARSYVDKATASTAALLKGWLTAQAGEAKWCAQAQRVSASNVTATFHVNTSECSQFASFDATYPSVSPSKGQVEVVTELQHNINIGDSSTVPEAATEIDCKTLPESSIAKAFSQTNGTFTASGCVRANQAALEYAYSLVPAATLERYHKVGKAFKVDADSVHSTVVTWQAASFGFQSDATHVKVQSPLLETNSDVLCKLLSPSRVVEYMMVDGQPRFDGTVP